MKMIPKTYRDLLDNRVRAIAHLATTMPDGSPQVTPVWFDTDGEYIRINSAEGRVKDRNIRARPAVALEISDPNNPYRYIQIRGKVVEITNENAREHINDLSIKYMGHGYTDYSPNQVRVIYKVLPIQVSTVG